MMGCDVFDEIDGAGLSSVAYAMRVGKTMEYVRRFAVGNEPSTGPTETYEAQRAKALLDRLLELIEHGEERT
jgi:hypothetical protein